jgi:hypothetical protein
MPSQGFANWVNDEKTDADHFYCAYPQATTRMVSSALQAFRHLRTFATIAAQTEGDPDRFAAELQQLLDKVAGVPREPRRLPRGGVKTFAALIPIQPESVGSLRAVLQGLGPDTAGGSPFAGVPGTHAVRLAVLDSFGSRAQSPRRLHPALLSISALVDGPVTYWLRSMGAVLQDGGDSIWAHCSGWPGPGPAVTARWLLGFEIRTHECIIAHPAATADQIVDALRQQRDLQALAVRARALKPKELRQQYDALFGTPELVSV